ncbi:MAG: LysM peptidoglycan-binding domain-containing protein [Prevotellaceae bacterium]|jgi:LysM repeat protein|nr:LysM peptidoglycan-binding domain-containing protein [Prevotellaceae bacterium]
MKKIKYLFSFVLLLFIFPIFSQVEIKKSTEKIRINDKVYYIHHVKQGETIYSLCRVYGVTQEELIAANPQLSQGLKAEQRIKIPDKTTAKTKVAQTPSETKQEDDKNAVKTEDIQSVNTNDAENSAIKHKLKSGDNLVELAKKYNCTVEDILKYNPHLNKNSKLKKGQYLTIYPDKRESLQAENIEENTAQQDTLIDTITETLIDTDCNKNLYSADVLNVILMLPIKTNEINDNTIVKNQRSVYDFVEFYEGFLLAIDSLKSKNISINLTTFDVYDAQTLKTALNSSAFDEAQLVISHVPKNLTDTLAKVANEHKIPVVTAFSQETENIAEQNKYFIQALAPTALQLKKLNTILCSAEQNIIVIYEEISDTANFDNFVQTLENCGKTVKKYHYRLRGSRNENLQSELDNNVKNNVIALSNSRVFITDVVSKLNEISISLKCDVTVYGLPHWQTFEKNLNFDHVHNLNLSTLNLFFVDYDRDDVKNFINKYRYYYKGDPSQFSFHGYDLGIYFIERLAKYGTDFMQCITKDEASTLLQTRFKFDKISPQGGLVNTELLLLRHTKDLNIIVE